jgi:carboxymethylenebutenolidase
MRLACGWLADEGFNALCPDLFWRIEPGVDMSDKSEAELRKGIKLYREYDFHRGDQDIRKAVDIGRRMPGGNGKVAVLGYWLGGLMAFRAAAQYPVDAAVSYYGGGIDKYLHEAGRVHSPLLMHLADDDEYLSACAQAQIHLALVGKPEVVIETYEGTHHAFARRDGQHFDSCAAALANSRSLRFLREYVA